MGSERTEQTHKLRRRKSSHGRGGGGKGVLGDANPVSLNHTVFYVLSQHFGTSVCLSLHASVCVLAVKDKKQVELQTSIGIR